LRPIAADRSHIGPRLPDGMILRIIAGFRPGTWLACSVPQLRGNRLTGTDWRPTQEKRNSVMKQGIHPEYREVVFQDMQTDFRIVTRSTVQSRESIEIDGKTYPLIKLDTSSDSHPFYTGAQTRIVETGRVEKFRQKFAAKTEQVNAAAAAASKAKDEAAAKARKK
jgi:large subunit ribosomal protein L31